MRRGLAGSIPLVFCVVFGVVLQPTARAADDEAGRAAAKLRRLDAEIRTFTFEAGDQVSFVEIHGSRLGPADLELLTRLPTVESLDLSRTQITDAGLRVIARLTELRDLDLGQTAISDQGLEPLRSLV